MAEALTIRNTRGLVVCRVANGVFRNNYGFTIGKLNGQRIENKDGQLLGTIDDRDIIRTKSGRPKGRFTAFVNGYSAILLNNKRNLTVINDRLYDQNNRLQYFLVDYRVQDIKYLAIFVLFFNRGF